MSNPVYTKKINYDISLGNNANLLLEPFDVRGIAFFCFQFVISGVVGAPLDGLITMKISNDGVNFKEIVPGTTLFPYFIVIDTAGTFTYFMFVGTVEGVSSARLVNFAFTANGLTAGLIESCTISGEQASA